MSAVWFIVGLLAGATIMVVLLAILAVAKEEDNAVSRRDASE